MDLDLEILVCVDVEVLGQILLIFRPCDLMNLFKGINDSFQFFLCDWRLWNILWFLARAVDCNHFTGWSVFDAIIDFLKVVSICLLDLVVLVSPIEVEGIIEALGDMEDIMVCLGDMFHGLKLQIQFHHRLRSHILEHQLICLFCGCLLNFDWLPVGVCGVYSFVHIVHIAVIALSDKRFGASSPITSKSQLLSF